MSRISKSQIFVTLCDRKLKIQYDFQTSKITFIKLTQKMFSFGNKRKSFIQNFECLHVPLKVSVESCLTAKQTFKRLIYLQTDDAALAKSSNMICNTVYNVIYTWPEQLSSSVSDVSCHARVQTLSRSTPDNYKVTSNSI